MAVTISQNGTICIRNGNVSISTVASSLPAIDYFRTNRDQITLGGTADLSWSVRNATSVILDTVGTVPSVSATTVAPVTTRGGGRECGGDGCPPLRPTFTYR